MAHEKEPFLLSSLLQLRFFSNCSSRQARVPTASSCPEDERHCPMSHASNARLFRKVPCKCGGFRAVCWQELNIANYILFCIQSLETRNYGVLHNFRRISSRNSNMLHGHNSTEAQGGQNKFWACGGLSMFCFFAFLRLTTGDLPEVCK